MHLHLHVPVPQPSPGTPIHIPDEAPPLIIPPEPGTPPEITDPPPEPTLPVREPGINVPPQANPFQARASLLVH
jgi:hypothetical protein